MMRLARRSRGFTVFELAVAATVIGVLAVLLLNRLSYYQEMAEKAAMESMAKLVKTGLQLRLADLIATNRQGEAATLEIADPMQWLDARPVNYGGDYGAGFHRGTWYFDSGRRHLVYVVNVGDRLETDTAGAPKEVRFHARLVRDRLEIGGKTAESVTAVTLSPVAPYRWP
jgi:type II secretory pathway pseudopilin PulG